MRKWFALFLALIATPALAQTGTNKTQAQLNTEVGTTGCVQPTCLWPDNTTGQITPFYLRQVGLDLIATLFTSFPTGIATIAANSILGTVASGPPIALAMPNCTSALIWTTGTGIGCNAGLGTGSVTAGAQGLAPYAGGPSTLFQEQMPMGGRITLVSGTCVATTDQAAQTAVYYAPCGVGKYIPIYNGTYMALYQFTSSETDQIGLSLALGSNWAASTIFDVFVVLNSSVVTLCTVPWSNSGAGTSARTTAVTQYKGVWVNATAISSACRNTNSGSLSVSQYQGTYVGSFITNGSTGTVDLKFGTAASDGGTACICIWNVYNQVQASAFVGDTTTNWNYTTATFRQANGQAGNQINVLQGLAGQPIDIQVTNSVVHSGNPVNPVSGIGIDSTSSDSSTTNAVPSNVATTAYGTSMAWYSGVLSAGFHNIVRLEYSTATGTTTWLGYQSPASLTGIKGKIWY